MFKIGDQVKVVEGYTWGDYALVEGSVHTVTGTSDMADTVNLGVPTQWWGVHRFVLANPPTYTTDDYAAAFNAWMNDFVNSPQAFEDSHTTAIRHLTEKLNGEEPSYGAVCSVLFQEYLNKTGEK